MHVDYSKNHKPGINQAYVLVLLSRKKKRRKIKYNCLGDFVTRRKQGL